MRSATAWGGIRWLIRVLGQARFVEGAVESLLRTLEWAKLNFDDGERRAARSSRAAVYTGVHRTWERRGTRTVFSVAEETHLRPILAEAD